MKLSDIKLGCDEITNKYDVKQWLDDMSSMTEEIMYLFGFSGDCKYKVARNIVKFSEKTKGQFDENEMFRILKENKCKGFILVHNHPTGSNIPSKIDIETTKEIMKDAKKHKMIFMEHFVFGKSDKDLFPVSVFC